MHIQVINFNIKVSVEDYEEGTTELAPVFAAVKENSDFEKVTSKDSSVLGAPEKIARGLLSTLPQLRSS